MEAKVMKALVDAFERSDWQELDVTIGSDRLALSRLQDAEFGSAATATAPAKPAAPPEPAATEDRPSPEGTVVESPSVGLFRRAPSPDAPPFAEEGAAVAAGDTVAIVEVSKLPSHVATPVDGTVTDILVDDGAAVEYGQALVIVASA